MYQYCDYLLSAIAGGHESDPELLLRVQVGMSLILSFFFVWDTPSIAAGMRTLRTSRFRAIYNEVAPTFAVFGRLFGKALQAQVSPCSSTSNLFPRDPLRLNIYQA